MKPVRLEFQAIKSYVNKTVVDFSGLISSGLFGIFGNTGSGKSTILDCLILALYGRTPKLKQASDFVSLGCSYAYVDFIFSMLENVKYHVRREFKFQSGKWVQSARLSRLEEKSEIPVCDKALTVNEAVIDILGLDIDDFEKCIILPQGEFASFVSMQRHKRLEMMSGLFNLEKYGAKLIIGFKKRVDQLYTRIMIERERLEGYKDADNNALRVLGEDIKVAEDEKILSDINYSKIKDEFFIFKDNYEKGIKLEQLRKKQESLSMSLENMKIKQSYLNKFHNSAAAINCGKECQSYQRLVFEDEKSLSALTDRQSLLSKQVALNEAGLLQLDRNKAEFEDLIKETALLEALKQEISDNINRNKEIAELREKLSLLSSRQKQIQTERNSLNTEWGELTASSETTTFEALLDCIKGRVSIDFVIEEIDFLKELLNACESGIKGRVGDRIEQLNEYMRSCADGDVNELLRAVKEMYERVDRQSSKRQELSEKRIKLESAYERIEAEKNVVISTGKGIKTELDRSNERIGRILQGRDYERVVRQNSSRMAEIKKYETDFLKRSKQLADERSDCESQIAVTNERLLTNKSYLNTRRIELSRLLIENDLTLAQADEIVSTVQEYEQFKRNVEAYFTEKYATEQRILEIEKEISGCVIDDAAYQEMTKRLSESEQGVKVLNKNLDKLTISYENLSQKIKERCIIEANLKETEKKYKLYNTLFELLKNNALVEYVAEEYLKEIAGNAGTTLLALTDGRLGLMYEKEFFVEDNVLGGECRKVDTVSGGELFLVSLALALALSAGIYAKSRRPIEFFFLDEGFGSLDDELVETVTDSLIKLRKSNLTIGVISHVNAMKERIQAKISVTKNSENEGSSISIDA